MTKSQFIGQVTDERIKARTEERFGLPRTNPDIKPQLTREPDVTNPAPGLPITATHIRIRELQEREK